MKDCWSFITTVDHWYERLSIMYDKHWSLPWKPVDHLSQLLIMYRIVITTVVAKHHTNSSQRTQFRWRQTDQAMFTEIVCDTIIVWVQVGRKRDLEKMKEPSLDLSWRRYLWELIQTLETKGFVAKRKENDCRRTKSSSHTTHCNHFWGRVKIKHGTNCHSVLTTLFVE